MKKFYVILLAAAALATAAVSCKKDEPAKESYKIEYTAPTGLIGIGKDVNFTDLSLSVTSRTWTFQDGTPATSTEPTVTVSFASAGAKKVTLSDTFKDGTVLTEEITVNVVEPINGEITVAEANLTPLGCIRVGAATKFSIGDLKGTPDKFEWTFEGGSPATSSDAEPSVTFEKGNRNGAKVTCKVSRTADGASENFEGSWIVGNYPINYALPDLNYDPFGFECEKAFVVCNMAPIGSTSREDHGLDWCSIVEGGANGTAHAIKISYAEANTAKSTQFTYDRNWMCNGRLQAGKTYRITYWWKPVFDGEPTYVSTSYDYANQLKDSYKNKVLEVNSGDDWAVFYPGETFAPQGKTKFCNGDGTDGMNNRIGDTDTFLSDWIFHSHEFVCPENADGDGRDLLNPYMYWNVYTDKSPNILYVLFDELWIDLVEEPAE